MSPFITELEALHDKKLKMFTAKLVPNIEEKRIIGVRIPQLRSFAKKLFKESPDEVSIFFENLPHFYLEENLLHSFLLEQITEEEFKNLLKNNDFMEDDNLTLMRTEKCGLFC